MSWFLGACLAGIEQARTVLTNRDDFIAALSRFDRSARMKTDQELTEADFLAFLGRSGCRGRPPKVTDSRASSRTSAKSNPDGYETGWFINVTNGNQTLPTIPILYADRERYDPRRGGEFFAYLVFKPMVITNANGNWQPLLVQRQPQLLDPREAQGFFEQVGRNTGYRFADARRPTHAHRIQGPENPDWRESLTGFTASQPSRDAR
jgi:hypothetical protein